MTYSVFLANKYLWGIRFFGEYSGNNELTQYLTKYLVPVDFGVIQSP